MRWMIGCSAIVTLIAAMGWSLSVNGQQRVTNRANVEPHALIWSDRPGEPLFVEDPGSDGSDAGLTYKDKEFTVSLLQPLSFNRAGGYFVWWVRLEKESGVRMVCFWPASDRRYKSTGLTGEVEDLGKLKLLRTATGAAILFTVAGDGQLRPVSVTNPAGHRLLIDYTATGLIQKIRDEGARESSPEYDGERIRALVQIWYRDGAKYLTMAQLR